MKQFDVLPYSEGSAEAPYLVVLQHDAIDDRDTTIVAPCIEARIGPRHRRLSPEVEIRGRNYVVVTSELSAMRRSSLRSQPIANLAAHRNAFTRAIDLLFTGI
jgi:hypothetical protein